MRFSSNFARNLRNRHPEEHTEHQQTKKDREDRMTSQVALNKLVLAFITKNMLPVAIVESKSFKDLVSYANPSLRVMSRPSAMNMAIGFRLKPKTNYFTYFGRFLRKITISTILTIFTYFATFF